MMPLLRKWILCTSVHYQEIRDVILYKVWKKKQHILCARRESLSIANAVATLCKNWYLIRCTISTLEKDTSSKCSLCRRLHPGRRTRHQVAQTIRTKCFKIAVL